MQKAGVNSDLFAVQDLATAMPKIELILYPCSLQLNLLYNNLFLKP